jgi:hypothetical protein
MRVNDRVLLAAFGSKVQVIHGWSSENDTAGIDRERNVCQLTNLYQALRWAAQELRDIKTRRGVVILTDGVDSGPDSTAESDYRNTLNVFRVLGIPLYFVAVGTDLNPTPGIPGKPLEVRKRMEELAEVSGGRVALPRTPADVVPIYEQIARELGTSYSLGYALPNPIPDGKRHRIQVRLPANNFQIRQSRLEYVSK